MGEICTKLNPTGCLECISGDMAGDMFNFVGRGGTIVMYGGLSGQKVQNINNFALITKGIRMEGYMLTTNTLDKLDLKQFQEFSKRA